MRSSYRDLIKLYADRDYSGRTININNVSHSRIRSLEILGQTTETGEGVKGPDNPYELVVCTEAVINVCEDNLANPQAAWYNSNIIGSSAGINGTKIYGTSNKFGNYLIGLLIPVQPNNKYYLTSFECGSSLGYALYPRIMQLRRKIAIHLSNSTEDFKNSVIQDNVYSNYTLPIEITANSETNFIIIGVSTQSVTGYAADDDVWIDNVMVSLRNIPYAPYTEQSLTIPYTLHGIPVTLGGNYTDDNGQQWVCDTYNPLTGEYVQRIGKITLDGSENWSDAYYDSLGFFQLSIQNLPTNSNTDALLSNRWVTKSTGYKYANAIFKQSNYKILRISPSTDIATDLSTFKNFLSSNNTTVLYALEKPVVTTLTPTDLYANVPNTTIQIDETNGLGNIKAVLQTKE